PCSGEGMFRKYDFAGDEWSPAEVLSCAALQKEILCNASAMVKSGGYLLYSTCTFSLEENERQIDCFLTQHPEFDTVDVPLTLRCSTAGGMTEDTCLHPLSIARTRRFYPHISPGEGQYICLMQKKGGGFEDNPCFTPLREKWQKGEKDCAETFLRDNLEELSGFTLHKYGEVITLLPEKVWVPPHSVYAAGIQVGSVQKGRIEPHHQFFSAFGNFMKRKINLCLSDTRLKAYLRGEQIETNEEDGYGAVLAEGVPLGGVKIVSGVAKNRYPKGLRQNE
ncbi:MAG: hypothetical protein MJ078_08075, partial [Clostridia bacterium]|nr:hypothetical protein [Clostridia bacterium]